MLPATLFSHHGHRVTSVLVLLFLASLLSTKSAYSYVLGGFTLYAVWQFVRSPGIRLQRTETWVVSWMMLFFFFGVLAAVIHSDPFSSYEVPAKFAFAVVLIMCCIKYPPKPVFFWIGLALGALSGLAVAYWKMLHSLEFKAYGYTGAIQFGNLSLTMGIILMIGLWWACRYQGEYKKWWVTLLVLGSASGLLGSYFSGTRGGWIALPVFMFLFCLAYLRRKNLWVTVMVLTVTVGSVLAVSTYSPLVQERIQAAASDVVEYQNHGLDSAGSIGSRLAIWGASLGLLKDKPIFGLGQVQFRSELARLEHQGLLGSVPASLANTHNTFLEVWVMYGGLALLSLLGLLISLSWHFLRYVRSTDSIQQTYALAGLCLVIGYVVYSQTQVMLSRNNTLVFFLVMVAALLGLLHQRRLELQG